MTTFSFTAFGDTHQLVEHDGRFLRLSPMNPAFARLTAATADGTELPLPEGYTMVTTFCNMNMLHEDAGHKDPCPVSGMFVILFGNSYEVFYMNEKVLTLKCDRTLTWHIENSGNSLKH